MRTRLALLVATSLVALAAVPTALAGNGGFGPPDSQSPNGSAIGDAYWFIFILTLVIFLLVEVALIVSLVKHRSRGRSRSIEGDQTEGGKRLEITWTVIPIVIVTVVAGFVFYKLPEIKNTPAANARDQIAVKVDARQFYWAFQYGTGELAVNTLVLPVNKVVTFDLTSPDVIHSFWVPELAGKIDAIPGETTHLWLQPQQEGRYRIRCAELCGFEHAHMTGWVQVVSEPAYRRFLAGHAPSSAAVGKETAEGVCATCHGLAGEGGYGPALVGNAAFKDAAALKALLLAGGKKMPPVGKHWSDDQLNATVAYLQKRYGGGS